MNWQKAIRNARTLVDTLCMYYMVPRARVIVNPNWLAQVKARGAYFPEFHMLVFERLSVETPFDCLIVLHEFWHHADHAAQHQ